MLSKLRQRRIAKLIEFMEVLPRSAERHFSMDHFLSHSHDGHSHSVPRSPKDMIHSCGTTACTLGWAATMPYFQRLGLKFKKNGELAGLDVVVDRGSWRWNELFGGYNEDVTPKGWAKRARGLLKEWAAK